MLLTCYLRWNPPVIYIFSQLYNAFYLENSTLVIFSHVSSQQHKVHLEICYDVAIVVDLNHV
jgi:hypothetical protein